MSSHHRVTEYLRIMENKEIKRLGGALGLDWPELGRMSSDLPAEMVAAWLKEKCRAQNPSWNSLVKALRDIEQQGIANRVEQCEINVTEFILS